MYFKYSTTSYLILLEVLHNTANNHTSLTNSEAAGTKPHPFLSGMPLYDVCKLLISLPREGLTSLQVANRMRMMGKGFGCPASSASFRPSITLGHPVPKCYAYAYARLEHVRAAEARQQSKRGRWKTWHPKKMPCRSPPAGGLL